MKVKTKAVESITNYTPKPPVRKGPIVTITDHPVSVPRETRDTNEPRIEIVQDLVAEANKS